MNDLPANILNLIVKLVPTSYAAISRLSRRHYGCVRGDMETIKTLAMRRVENYGAIYWVLPNGAYHGKYLEYDDNCVLEVECYYVDGRLHGKHKVYNANGTLYRLTNYVYGKRHGVCITYYYSGALFHVLNFENGKIHGKEILYHESGDITRKATYIHGQPCGRYVEYDESGNITQEFDCNNPKDQKQAYEYVFERLGGAM